MASSASAALLLLLLRFQGCLSSSARVSMLRRATVPASDWTVGETHSNKGETRMTCAARAITGGWYFSSLDASQGICTMGTADLANEGSGSVEVFMKDFPRVGFTLGNEAGDRGVDVVLPNGRSCFPYHGSGLPMFYYEPDNVQLMSSGVTEVDGVIYRCGGFPNHEEESRSGCFSFDLSTASDGDSWGTIPSLASADRAPPGGLLPYQTPAGDKVLYFVTWCTCCPESGKRIQRHVLGSAEWTKPASFADDRYHPAVTSDNRFIFLAGGHPCHDDTVNVDTAEAYDMAHPGRDAVSLSDRLPDGGRDGMAAAYMEVRGRRGLLLAGGRRTLVLSRDVWFLPLMYSSGGDSVDSAGPCEVLPSLPAPSWMGYIFNYGNGEAVLYGGLIESTLGTWTRKTYLWESESRSFSYSGNEAGVPTSYIGSGHMDAKLARRGCWKFL